MEYPDPSSPFTHQFHVDLPETHFDIQRTQHVPVDVRLRENRDRRLEMEREKQKDNQTVMEKRKTKEENIQKILRERIEAKDNARTMLNNMHKTSSNRFDEGAWRKASDLEEKIQEGRTRADYYKTMYKKKIHESNKYKENSARDRKGKKDQQEKDRSLNVHLSEWKSHEKKIAQKYKGETINYNRLYDGFLKKQEGLKQIMQQYQKKDNKNKENSEIPLIGKAANSVVKSDKDSKVKSQNSNPVYSSPQIGSFGLPKSIKNPQKILKAMKQFLQQNASLKQPTEDQTLLLKFQNYLDEQSNLQKL